MKTLKNGEYEYREGDFLGEGSFAKVYKGVIVKNQRVVAIRLLPLKLIKQYGNKIKTIISTPPPIQTARSPSLRNWPNPQIWTTSSLPASSTASSPSTTSP
jgi:hypothetical protein